MSLLTRSMGSPSFSTGSYHEEKAKGGLALTMFGGSTNVSLDSPAVFGNLHAGSDEIIPHFQALADRVHAHARGTRCASSRTWDVARYGTLAIGYRRFRPPASTNRRIAAFPKNWSTTTFAGSCATSAKRPVDAREGGPDGLELIAYGHLIARPESSRAPRTGRWAVRIGSAQRRPHRLGATVASHDRSPL